MKPTHAELQLFIESAKSKGASDESLTSILMDEGWPKGEVSAALARHWSQITGIEIPVRQSSAESSRDAFLYLLSFATLSMWSCALGALLFQLIDHWLPDSVTTANEAFLRTALSWKMASVWVAFPIYLLVMRKVVREIAAYPERLESGVRKWLTWLALLLTAGTLIGDLVCFFGTFFAGEVTERFVLKCGVVFALAGSIFSYYVGSLRAGAKTRHRVFAGAAVAVVGVVLFAATSVAGSPATQRRIAADARRVSDLRQIANAIFVYRAQNAGLPGSLDEPLIRQRLGPNTAIDPENGSTYEYRAMGNLQYELCARFDGPSSERPSFWNHGAGRACFSLNATQNAPM